MVSSIIHNHLVFSICSSITIIVTLLSPLICLYNFVSALQSAALAKTKNCSNICYLIQTKRDEDQSKLIQMFVGTKYQNGMWVCSKLYNPLGADMCTRMTAPVFLSSTQWFCYGMCDVLIYCGGSQRDGGNTVLHFVFDGALSLKVLHREWRICPNWGTQKLLKLWIYMLQIVEWNFK